MNLNPTQSQAILDRLQATPGEWVPMPELVALSGSYNIHTRIDELRHTRSVSIENRMTRAPGERRKQSFYRVPEKS